MEGCRWNFSANMLLLITCLLVQLAWQTSATKSKHIENMIEASKNQRITSLRCHVCHSETDQACFNFTEFGEDFEGFPQNCSGEQLVCMVKKFAFTSTDGNGTTTPMKTISVKRNCAKKCENGCVVMGERTRLYVCSQCCSDPLCNVGSGSPSLFRNLDNSFHHFLTSVANVHSICGSLHHLWHGLALFSLLSLQVLLT